MKKTRRRTTKTMLTTGVILCLIPSLTSAQRPLGDKGKKAAAGTQQASQRGALGNPDDMAAKLISDYDKNKDSELKVDELMMALAAQRQQRRRVAPRKPGGMEQKPMNPAQIGPGSGQRKTRAGDRRRRRGGQGDQQRTGTSRKRGQVLAGPRGPAGQGSDLAQIAKNLIIQFDRDQSVGLDTQELAASIQAQRQNQNGQGERAANRSGKSRPGQAKEGSRSRRDDLQKAGDDKETLSVRPGRATSKASKKSIEPGQGVIPKRPDA